jgi:hypothetical protein
MKIAVYRCLITLGIITVIGVCCVGYRNGKRDVPDDGVNESGTVLSYVLGWERIRLCSIRHSNADWECAWPPALIPFDVPYADALDFGVADTGQMIYGYQVLNGSTTLKSNLKIPSQTRVDVMLVRIIPLWLEFVVGLLLFLTGLFLREVYHFPHRSI